MQMSKTIKFIFQSEGYNPVFEKVRLLSIHPLCMYIGSAGIMWCEGMALVACKRNCVRWFGGTNADRSGLFLSYFIEKHSLAQHVVLSESRSLLQLLSCADLRETELISPLNLNQFYCTGSNKDPPVLLILKMLNTWDMFLACMIFFITFLKNILFSPIIGLLANSALLRPNNKTESGWHYLIFQIQEFIKPTNTTSCKTRVLFHCFKPVCCKWKWTFIPSFTLVRNAPNNPNPPALRTKFPITKKYGCWSPGFSPFFF